MDGLLWSPSLWRLSLSLGAGRPPAAGKAPRASIGFFYKKIYRWAACITPKHAVMARSSRSCTRVVTAKHADRHSEARDWPHFQRFEAVIVDTKHADRHPQARVHHLKARSRHSPARGPRPSTFHKKAIVTQKHAACQSASLWLHGRARKARAFAIAEAIGLAKKRRLSRAA